MGIEVKRNVGRELMTLGYTNILCVGEVGKRCLKISGPSPQPLPKWLEIPFAVVDSDAEFKFCPEKVCANETIEHGDCLYDETNGPIGTIGPITMSERPGKEPIHVILTAEKKSHVIPELTREMYVVSKSKRIKLDVSPTSRRTIEGELSRFSGPPWAEEAAFLIVDPNDFSLFNGNIVNVNCHLLRHEPVSLSNMRDPLAFPRVEALQTSIELSSLLYFKKGMSTDLTMGRLFEVYQKKPSGWWSDKDSDCDIDSDEWLGYVKWIPGIPFTAGGDSGSLVYAVENGVVLPLGIHIGVPTARHEQSCFVS